MGTPFYTDKRLNRFSDLTGNLTLELIQILAENYNAGKLSMGNNLTKKFSEKEVFYTLTDSQFENEILTFKYKNSEVGNPYEIILESKGNDSPTELGDRFYEFIAE